MLEFTLDNFTYGNEIVKYLGKWNYLIDPFTTHLSSEPTTTSEKTCGKVYALFLMTVTFSVSDAFFEIPPLEAVNYYHKALHLGCCRSPRSASSSRGTMYSTNI